MIGKRTGVLVVAALVGIVGRSLAGQAQAAAQHPTFAGTWVPSDPDRADKLFSVGLTRIPGGGHLTIEQTSERLTVTTTVPEDKLRIIRALSSLPFYPTMVYRLTGAEERSGDVDAGVPQPLTGPTWLGNRLVIPNAQTLPPSRFKGMTATYSLDGDQLKLESRWDLIDGRANNVTELFTRAK